MRDFLAKVSTSSHAEPARRDDIFRAMMIATLAILAGLTLASAGCRQGEDEQTISVGVLVPTGATPIAAAMRTAMTEYADETAILLHWRDQDTVTLSSADEEIEETLAEELLGELGIDALIYTPADAARATGVVGSASSHEVPLVALDAVPQNLYVAAFVTTDFVAAGEEAARTAIDYVERVQRVNAQNQINALVVDGSWRRESERRVATGFYNVLDAHATVRVVGRGSVDTADEAFRFVGDGINNYAGNVQLLLISSSRYVPGAILAAQTHGVAGWGIVSCGVGGGEEASRLIIREVHDFEIDNWPVERARLAIDIATRLARGETPEADGRYDNGGARVPVFYGPRRTISRENVAVMSDVWRSLYPE